MALLTNINGKLTVDSTGSVSFNRIGTSTTTGFTFPALDGGANQILKTNGSGVLSWVDDEDNDVVTKIIGGTNITVSPATGLGDVTVNADLSGTVTGSGTLNKVPRWTATGSDIGDGPITFSAATAAANSTFGGDVITDGIYKMTTSPDGNILELDQAGRSMDIGVYFASNSSNSEWQFKTSTGNVDGTTTEALVIKPLSAIFAGTITSGTLSVGTSGTSRFTDTNAYPLQLNRGLAVDVVGAAGTIFGLGAYSTGTTYIDAVRIVGVLEANGTDGDMQLQVLNSGTHATALTLNNDTNASFTGTVTAPRIGIPNANSSFALYNNSNSYFNGAVTVDSTFTQTGGAASSFSGSVSATGVIFANATLEVLGQNLTHGASRIKICQENTTKSQVRYYGADASTKGILEFMSTTSDGSASFTPLTLNADGSSTFTGNVGIGVTSPSWNLQVAGRALVADTTARLPFNVSRAGGGAVTNAATIVSGAVAYFNGNIAGSDALRIGSMDNGTGAYYIDVSNYAGTAAYNLILQPFLGKVGIGTTSPAAKFVVSNSGALGYEIDPANSSGEIVSLFSYNRSTAAWKTTRYSAADHIFETNGTTERMRIKSDGNILIAGTRKIEFYNTSQYIYANSTNDLTLASGDDINFQTNYARFFNAGVESARISATTNSWIGNGSNSKLGVNRTDPSYNLDVTGTIRATGDVIAYSDERVKENIKTIDNSLEKVSKLRGVEFNKIGDDVKSIGVIAQEIEKILPEVVKEDDKGMKSVAYGNISGLLIEAIKELKAEIEELKLNKCNCNCNK